MAKLHARAGTVPQDLHVEAFFTLEEAAQVQPRMCSFNSESLLARMPRGTVNVSHAKTSHKTTGAA